ncbi:MAG TPA: class I SAM-dependent methyltransferase, partial [Candidatus Acidoferrales bacterium]|nr:class I SAM-dependent methyltransferase [Candidatus Acidoferrales bacterium]
MHEPPVSEYDKFAYPSAVYPQTHPDRLSAISTLMGLEPARLERARVLELGCGDGNNLITMACTLPEANFLGMDLAIEPIRRGRETIAALGLTNIALRQKNVLETTADLGVFDYIIAHGLYSWVPEAVRERILQISREHLAENGVAYVSYNAYPGNHLRDAARRMMRFHVQQFSEPPEQIRQARAFLRFVSEAKIKPGLWQDLLRHQFERIEKYVDAGFFHDDLSPMNQPFYFYEFLEA